MDHSQSWLRFPYDSALWRSQYLQPHPHQPPTPARPVRARSERSARTLPAAARGLLGCGALLILMAHLCGADGALTLRGVAHAAPHARTHTHARRVSCRIRRGRWPDTARQQPRRCRCRRPLPAHAPGRRRDAHDQKRARHEWKRKGISVSCEHDFDNRTTANAHAPGSSPTKSSARAHHSPARRTGSLSNHSEQPQPRACEDLQGWAPGGMAAQPMCGQ
jgi:hypothetical protein